MDNQELINELRSCAAELEKLASSSDLAEKTASVSGVASSSERTDYINGVLRGLGID